MSIFKRYRKTLIGEDIWGIHHYNWGSGDWFARFLKSRFTPEECSQINMISTFGSRLAFHLHKNKHKIFFTGENPVRYPRFMDHALPYVELSMGFDDIEAKNYLRFPLWILYLFNPEDTQKDICRRIAEINDFRPIKTDNCSLICRHDENNLRRLIHDEVSKITKVACAGKYLHNDDRLWSDYANDKVAYLNNFKISICPENSNREGYVTEKLFEALKAGAIPLYWGSNNNPEPNLVNPEAILFWDFNSDNKKTLSKISELLESTKAYEEFLSQPRLLSPCAEYVWDRYQELEEHIRSFVFKL